MSGHAWRKHIAMQNEADDKGKDTLAHRLRLAVSLPDVDTNFSLTADDLTACADALERGDKLREERARYWVRCAQCGNIRHVHENAYRCRFCKNWYCEHCSAEHFRAESIDLSGGSQETAA